MSVVTTVPPSGTRPLTPQIARGVGTFIFVASVLFILFAGTFPFDFRFLPGGILHQIASAFDWRLNPWDPGHVDRRQNIMFFMPFGFGMASVIRIRRFRRLAQIAITFFAGALLSGVVESAQAFVSFRDPSFADVWCNTLGGVLGAIGYIGVGDKAMDVVARGLILLRPLAKPPIVGAAVVAYAIFQLSAPLLVRNPGDLSVWDPGTSLVIGNSITGDAAWYGSVSDCLIADRAVAPDQAMQLARGAEPTDVLGDSLLAHYRPRGEAPYPDLSHHVRSPLIWANSCRPIDIIASDAPPLHPEQWMRTTAGLEQVIHRIGKSSECTMSVTASPFNPDQRRPDAAPVTIMCIAAGWNSLNFVVAQDGPDLMVRVRTAVRGMPGLYLHNVFTNTNYHNIVVAVKQAQIVVFIDGSEQGRCEITPEAKGIWRLYPRVGFRLWIERYGFRSYAAIYRLLVFIPFSALLGAALAISNLSVNGKRVIATASILAMVIALEIILGIESAGGFQVRNMMISLAVGFASLGALAWWRRGKYPQHDALSSHVDRTLDSLK
jgi:hypothetical protein